MNLQAADAFSWPITDNVDNTNHNDDIPVMILSRPFCYKEVENRQVTNGTRQDANKSAQTALEMKLTTLSEMFLSQSKEKF